MIAVDAASGIADQLDLPGLGGLGLAGVVLGLVFRTLWRQDSVWQDIIDTERETSQGSRDAAAAARADAAEARAEALAARQEAKELRVRLDRALADADRAWAAHRAERARVDALVSALRLAGVALPDAVD